MSPRSPTEQVIIIGINIHTAILELMNCVTFTLKAMSGKQNYSITIVLGFYSLLAKPDNGIRVPYVEGTFCQNLMSHLI